MSELNQPDLARLKTHIAEFGRRIKLSGTPEELESFRYLESEMVSYGYRTELLSHDAYISLPGKARVSANGLELRCITHSMSVATSCDGVHAPLVYVGEGNEADFASVEVNGRIVLVDGIASEEVTALASARGAIGQLHVSPNEHLYEMCVSPVWGSPSQHNRAMLPTTVVCTIACGDGSNLRAQCLAGEDVLVSLWADVDTGWRKTPLLVAELPPEGDDRNGVPFVLLSGHHDTWHYGVMDNGGANATMLEVARLLTSQRGQWRRGLRLCFWSGHSHGRYSGSAWYADEHWEDLDRRCVAHVNVDSTGGEGASVLTNSAVIDELKSLAAEEIWALTGQQHAGRRHQRVADQSFWGIGIPSMFGSIAHQPPGGTKRPSAHGWWWHTPHDLEEHIDFNNLQRDTKIVQRVLWRLLTVGVLPFDYTLVSTSLRKELLALQERLGDRMDISDLLSSLDAFEDVAQTVVDMAAWVANDAIEQVNGALMRVSRLLVPLNYTTGDRFSHDSALPHLPWPSLAGLRELASLPHGSLGEPYYAVHARQCRNLIQHTLGEAEAALGAIMHPPTS